MSDGPAETPKTSSGLWLALGLAAVGFGTAAVNWNSALTEGTYYVSAAAIGPFLGFLGLAMLVAPRTEDVAVKPQGMRTLPSGSGARCWRWPSSRVRRTWR